jgi:hypothetical protein
MGFNAVRVSANCDMTTIAWQTDASIKDCRGFRRSFNAPSELAGLSPQALSSSI